MTRNNTNTIRHKTLRKAFVDIRAIRGLNKKTDLGLTTNDTNRHEYHSGINPPQGIRED